MDTMKDVTPYQPELDSLDWRTPLRRAKNAIERHVVLIAMSVLVALALLVAYEKIFPPIYKAEVVVQGEPVQDVLRNTYYANWNVFRKGDQKSEPELVYSGRVARAVVTDLNLKFNDVHHTFLTHCAYLWTDSWLGKKYRSVKEWFFPPDPKGFNPTPEQIEFARTVEAFKESVSVEAVSGTVVAKVVVKAPSHRAAEFANKVVEVYLRERGKMFKDEAEQAYAALETEVARAAEQIAALDKRKLEFDTKNKVILDFEKDKLVVGNWATLQSSINETVAAMASLEATIKVIDQQLANEPKEIVSARTLQDSKVKGMLQSREFELNSSLQSSRERYRPDSPEVTQIETLLARTRGELKVEPDKVEVGQERIVNPVYSELRQRRNSAITQLESARASLAEKRLSYAKLEQRLDSIPALVKEVLEQARIRDSHELRYKLLRERAMQADVSRATVDTTTPSVRIIDPAMPPFKPNWPRNIILVPSAIGLGLVVGVVLALLAEVFSPRVNRDRLASRPDIPVYAVIDLHPVTMLPGGSAAALPAPPSAVARLRRPSS